MIELLNSRNITFLLYELLEAESLLQRPRYAEHNREIFDATLNTAHSIAKKYFANHNSKGDANEPTFDGENVHLIPETKTAWDAFADAGLLAAQYNFDEGGMQLPEVILRTAMAYFNAANIATSGYPFLSIGAANLINAFANEEYKAQFLPPMMEGRYAGTMALTEPNQGSALADITTSAEPADDGSYRIRGQKMFISGGDQSITENIVHMVLAKIKGAPAGVKGISLFIVPKFLVNKDGSLGERNEVALAGLLHKMGYRNTTSTVLNFGEQEGAVGYLVGEAHRGLQYMFQMMNEARIGVGLGAACLAYQGYNYALDYARQRPQGRLPSNKNPESKQISLVQHADVRRLLLAQKTYAEGALALCLYASSLAEDEKTGESAEIKENASLLLDLLTPVVKSWPSKYGLSANEIAIQILGGSGYIREHPVEQYYRDQRLNPIHEGTEAIHGIDLLGRKVSMLQGKAYQLFKQQVNNTVDAGKANPQTTSLAEVLHDGLTQLDQTTIQLQQHMQNDVDLGLANATLYLDCFGRVVVAWIWLRQAVIAANKLANELHIDEENFYQGKLQAARYYCEWELPLIKPQLALLNDCNRIPFDMHNDWF